MLHVRRKHIEIQMFKIELKTKWQLQEINPSGVAGNCRQKGRDQTLQGMESSVNQIYLHRDSLRDANWISLDECGRLRK